MSRREILQAVRARARKIELDTEAAYISSPFRYVVDVGLRGVFEAMTPEQALWEHRSEQWRADCDLDEEHAARLVAYYRAPWWQRLLGIVSKPERGRVVVLRGPTTG